MQLNRSQLQALLVGDIILDDLSNTHREELAATQLKVVGSGMRTVGVPVGTETFQWQSETEAMQGDPAELLRCLVPIEVPQASFQIRHLSAVNCMTLLLRTFPLSLTRDTAGEYDALLK